MYNTILFLSILYLDRSFERKKQTQSVIRVSDDQSEGTQTHYPRQENFLGMNDSIFDSFYSLSLY